MNRFLKGALYGGGFIGALFSATYIDSIPVTSRTVETKMYDSSPM